MSGRLVILRHKKWNVWNQDNIEKVLRDERLHKEETEAKKKQERYQSNAQIRETLQNRIEGEPEESALCLIPEKEEDISNDEHRKEEEERELLKRRREGIAPWALSDTQPGKNKITPWYARETGDQTKSVYAKGYMQVGDSAQAVIDRDERRKRSIDPMAAFIQEQDDEVAESKVGDSRTLYDKYSIMGMKQMSSSPEHPAKKHKHSKKDKKHKKKKDKKEEKHERSEDLRNALREKRLERERAERKRANAVITQHETMSHRHKYSDQYNPNFSKY